MGRDDGGPRTRARLVRIAVENWSPGTVAFGDDIDATFKTEFDAPLDGMLRFEGIATLATISVDGAVVSEFAIDVGASRGAACSRSAQDRGSLSRTGTGAGSAAQAAFALASEGGRPQQPSLVPDDPQRTGAGFAPGPPVVGLWRPVWFASGEVSFDVRTRLDGDEGVVTLSTGLSDGIRIRIGDASAIVAGGRAELRLSSPTLWWPHTHGEPHLYELSVEGHDIRRRIGFRTLASPGDILRDGLQPKINGVDIFVRGALWTPVPEGQMRSTLETARDHSLNAVRIPGTMTYERAEFHDLCDEFGILVWQDLMFANMDYPFDDPDFRTLVGEELDSAIRVIGGRPSTFCICGGSEIEQQVAMLGLDPAIGRPPFFAAEVPAALAEAEVDALYVPSAPCGADRPLLPSQGVSNWFGVGGYLRPFSEIRSAGVRFASECLALANVGDNVPNPTDPAWKQGVPKDEGADWDFDDVRDHYLKLLYEVDPDELRASDPDRYLELSRRVSGDVMAEVFGEWRRPASGCGGAFVLWLRDLVPGAGWGLIDSDGAAKPVLLALRAVLAPVAIWMTDEGMGGYGVHVANDSPEALDATIEIILSRAGQRVDGGQSAVAVPSRSTWSGDAETIIGRWLDVAYTYRFGPPAHDLVTAELRSETGELLGTARRYPLGRASAA